MREIQSVNKVYEFDELPESVQAKVLEKLYDINVDYKWHDCTLDEFYLILDTIGVACPKDGISFSDFSSQGDGLSFIGRYSYRKEALKKIVAEFPTWTELHKAVKAIQALQSRYFYRISGEIRRISYFYSHENTVSFSSDEYSQSVDDAMNEFFRDIMREFYYTLDKEYEYLTSNDAIIETIKANGYEFTMEGDMI